MEDIWGLWQDGVERLKEFHNLANSIHPNIQVDLRFGTEKIEFLDVNVSIVDNHIITDLFSKPSDKHLYLHKDSCHPESTKRAIPYGLGVRIKRICSDTTKYSERRKELCEQLRCRGYNENQVDAQLKRIDTKNRDSLLNYRKKQKNTDRVPIVLTYHSALPNVHNILKKRQNTLFQSQRMQEIFNKTPIVAYRRDTNLQDILIHKKHNKNFFNNGNVCKPCGKNCAICPFVTETDHLKDEHGKEYKVRNFINCKSVNVVYAIFCLKCDRYVYVGETGDTLYQRHILNFSLIRRQQDDPVAKHFYTEGHTKDDYRIVGIEKLFGTDEYRRTREKLWMKKLHTYKPLGINTKEQ